MRVALSSSISLMMGLLRSDFLLDCPDGCLGLLRGSMVSGGDAFCKLGKPFGFPEGGEIWLLWVGWFLVQGFFGGVDGFLVGGEVVAASGEG